MKKFLFNALIILLVISLFSCGTYQPPANDSTGGDTEGDSGGNENGGNENEGESSGGGSGEDTSSTDFTVSLVLNGQAFIPKREVTVRWTGENQVVTAKVDENGVATAKGLDGDYNVTLSGLGDAYAYDPNAHTASNLRRNIIIEVFEVIYPMTSASGSNYYGDVIEISEMGVYRVKLTSSKPVYYQFVPLSAGSYVIESWVDTTSNTVNPICDFHQGSVAYKNPTPVVYNDGGYSSTYTKNFSFTPLVDKANLSGQGSVVFCFGVHATLREGTISKDNPVYVDVYVRYVTYWQDPNLTGSTFYLPNDMPKANFMSLSASGKSYTLEMSTARRTAYITDLLSGSFRSYSPDHLYSVTFHNEGNAKTGEVQIVYNTKTFFGTSVTDVAASTYRFTYDGTESLKLEHKSGSVIPNLSITVNYYWESWYAVQDRYGDGKADTTFTYADLGTGRFDSKNYKLNPETGFYHRYDATKYAATNGFGPILYAYISSPSPVLGTPLTAVEAQSSALTLRLDLDGDGKTERWNYKLFIEGWDALLVDPPGVDLQPYLCTASCPCRVHGNKNHPDYAKWADLPDIICMSPDGNPYAEGACLEGCNKCSLDCRQVPQEVYYQYGYADVANSDGMVPVTEELHDFLLYYAKSQMIFKDGYGIAEPTYNAAEGDQWLFACGFYDWN
ncbi:MAG: hypothetical protein IJY65_05815 [Clostridia bacterium]|nr:hypothetical protein [Clostridia bacterium]